MEFLRPEWNTLYETAAAQEGLFTTQQAADAGYSTPLIAHYLNVGRFSRVRRGVYRLVHFPPGKHEELVAVWLWAERAGVISHETALALHNLSDALPAKIHMTVPEPWVRRRLRVPAGVILHYAEVPDEQRVWFGGVPATNPTRTLNDCARDSLSPELLRQGAQQALRRGIVTKPQLVDVEQALAPFGGLTP